MARSVFEDAEFETLLCDTPRPGVARIVLNRPSKLNAYTFLMTQELQAAIAAYRDQDALKALIISGAGAKAFCSGGDISGENTAHLERVRAETLGYAREMREGMQAVVAALHRLDKPSLAMIQGYAVAGGLALALGCDFRFAAESAKLGDTSNKSGLLPDEGGAWLFPRAMGFDRALKMSLLSEVYDAHVALGVGLVTEVVPDALLEDRCLSFCQTLAQKAPLAMRLTKIMMLRAANLTLEESMTDAQLAVMVTNPSADAREGVRAFREKRAPKFEGR